MKENKYLTLITILILCFNSLFSQSPYLDTVFGNEGIAILDPIYSLGIHDRAFDLIPHYDDKILLSGTSGFDMVIAQVDTLGNINKDFGNNGSFYLDNNFLLDEARIIHVDSSKNIYIGINSGWYKQFVVVKLNKDGKIIKSYGNDGKAVISTNKLLSDMVVDDTGRCFLTGCDVMCSLLPNGELDTNFGENGFVSTGVTTSYYYKSMLALTFDNKILFCGTISSDTSEQMVFKKYNYDGELDTTFGILGAMYHSPTLLNSYKRPQDITFLDSTLLISTFLGSVGNVMAFKMNGEADSSFGINGIASLQLNSRVRNESITIKDNNIIIGCIIGDSLGIAKFNPDGSLDLKFNSKGYSVTNISANIFNINVFNEKTCVLNNSFYQLATSTDRSSPNWYWDNRDFVLIKYNQDGSVDSMFGNDGKKFLNFGADEVVSKFVKTENGNIIQLGKSLVGKYKYQPLLFGLDSVGNIDSTFQFNFDVDFTNFRSGQLLTYKKSIFVSMAGHEGSYCYKPYICKINQEGSLDTSFNHSGYIAFQDKICDANMKISIVENGKLLALWSQENGCAVYMFNENGTLDTEFGHQGKIYINLSDNYEKINDIYFTYDNKILLSGTYSYTEYCGLGGCMPMSGQALLIRLNSDGSYDTTFANNGVIIVPQMHQISNIELLQSGKILCSGSNLDNTTNLSFVKFLYSGELDSSYAENGILSLNISFSGQVIKRAPSGDILIGDNPMYIFDGYQIDTLINFNEEFTPNTSFLPSYFAVFDSTNLFMTSSKGTGRINLLKYKLPEVTKPSVQVQNLTYSFISNDTLRLSYENGNGRKRIIFMSEGTSEFPGIKDNTTYYPSADWSSKLIELGSSGWFCIYNGDNKFVNVINADKSISYKVVALEYNGASKWEKYNHEVGVDNMIEINTPKLISVPSVNDLTRIYPNPCKGYCILEFNQKEADKICVYNVKGQLIESFSNVKSRRIKLDANSYENGIYFVHVLFNDKNTVYKLIVK